MFKKFLKLLSSIAVILLIGVFLLSTDKPANAEGEIEIYTLEDLDDVRNDLTASYILMNDLDFSDDGDYENIANKTTWTTGEGWVPIGTYTTPFSGIFDGQEYTISNLLIDKPTDIYDVGLFGANSGTIQNLGVLDADVTGHNNPSPTPGEFTGALVGYNLGTISNCNSSGRVETDASHAGGLVGYNREGTISDSYSSATVYGTGSGSAVSIGGLLGRNDYDALVENCYATGDVIGSGDSYTGGGLIGHNEGGTITGSYATGDVTGFDYDNGGLVGYSYDGDISTSFATGAVEGDDNVGGLVGTADGTVIENCYATGNVTENDDYRDGYKLGGLVGKLSGTTSQINSCYSTGVVDAGDVDDVGGLVGTEGKQAYVFNSFWDTETSGMGVSGGGTGKTTEEMQTLSTFNDTATTGLDTAWDIVLMNIFDPEGSDIWYIDEDNDYPRLFIEYVESEDPPEDPPAEEETDAEVTTSTATNITTNSAQLNANLTTLGTYDTVDVYFQYRETGGEWSSSNKISRTSIGVFSKNLTGLNPNSTYEFKAVIEFGTSNTAYGSIKSLTTTKVVIPKVRITDIGLISWVLDLDDMLYYFTSQTPQIKGVAYKNSHVKFVTEDEEFETNADSNGDFNLTLDLPRGTNEIEYYAYNDFGSQSLTRTLTLVIGQENFPPDEEEDNTEEQEDDNEENTEEEIEETPDDTDEDSEEKQILTFIDDNGDPLSGATIEIDGKTYTTNEKWRNRSRYT